MMIERMTYRKHKKKWMIYPEDKFKNFWDLLMTIILLSACITTPLEIAFNDVNVTDYNPMSVIIDVFFLIDILLIFNTAYYDEEQEIISCRKKIACTYIKGWFVFDSLAVIPFD